MSWFKASWILHERLRIGHTTMIDNETSLGTLLYKLQAIVQLRWLDRQIKAHTEFSQSLDGTNKGWLKTISGWFTLQKMANSLDRRLISKLRNIGVELFPFAPSRNHTGNGSIAAVVRKRDHKICFVQLL